MRKQSTFENNFIGVTEILSIINEITKALYSLLNIVVGPLSVYVCALNRTFLLIGWGAWLVRTEW